jgi:hypothetical protein
MLTRQPDAKLNAQLRESYEGFGVVSSDNVGRALTSAWKHAETCIDESNRTRGTRPDISHSNCRRVVFHTHPVSNGKVVYMVVETYNDGFVQMLGRESMSACQTTLQKSLEQHGSMTPCMQVWSVWQ